MRERERERPKATDQTEQERKRNVRIENEKQTGNERARERERGHKKPFFPERLTECTREEKDKKKFFKKSVSFLLSESYGLNRREKRVIGGRGERETIEEERT